MRITRKVEGDTLFLMEGDTQLLSMQEIQGQDPMTIAVNVAGDLKQDTVHDFGDELMALAGFGMHITLSLEGVEYLSNAAMRTLLDVQKRLDALDRGSLTIQKVKPAVLESMQSTGITELLMIETEGSTK